MKKTKVGIIGCGNISGIYLENLTKKFRNVELAAISELITERANEVSEKYSVKAVTTEELLNNPEIEIVLNLTTPQHHFEINMAALKAGKNVYCEKPLALRYEDGVETIKYAAEKGLKVGCAPDTFLGAGIQTCIKLINDGWIGSPVAATAFMTCHGHESWHPDPEFYYKNGGGPVFDMGPYYLTALVAMLGSVSRITGSCQKSFATRTITSEKKYGNIVDVEVPTHAAGVLDFKCGAVGTLIMSFDIWSANLPRIEVYGSLGSLSIPDPNTFGGPVKYKSHLAGSEWQDIPLLFDCSENSRGLGVSDMANSIQNGLDSHRANGNLACHILELMEGLHVASESGSHYILKSGCEKPQPRI